MKITKKELRKALDKTGVTTKLGFAKKDSKKLAQLLMKEVEKDRVKKVKKKEKFYHIDFDQTDGEFDPTWM